MTRRSLRDRNTAAIANEVTSAPEEPQGRTPIDVTNFTDEQRDDIEVRQQHFEAIERMEREEAAAAAARKQKRAGAAADDTGRIGIYLTPAEFDDARGAYLADWTNGGDADTFGRWIAGALDAHAGRTPKQRADLGGLRGRSAERTGSTRSFTIPTAIMQRMRAAITADQKAGRWPSDSAWSAEAIAIAVDQARRANGGTLPAPPARLPNRLAR